MRHAPSWRENTNKLPCGHRGDRMSGMSEPLTMPQQPRDPLKAAAAAYCGYRHRDSGAEACKGQGDCAFCQEAVALVIRAYNNAAHT